MKKFNLFQGDCLEVLKTIPDASIDSIVTDPPYGLSKQPDIAEVLTKWLAGEDYTHRGSGFMGKSWDSFVPGPAVWRECFRVLKPGGHLIAFAGSRTYDLMAIAVRLGGFEIRDSGCWITGSGFPKSLDISKAVDKLDASEKRRERQLRFTAWMRETGLGSSQIDQITGTNMGGHYLTRASQPAVPTRDLFEMLRPHLTCPVPEWVEELINERTVESENYKRREVISEREVLDIRNGHGREYGSAMYAGEQTGKMTYKETAPSTPEAKQWQGWGTALKPAHEPFVIARKPLDGTVANNVMKHGVGGLNIDGCRHGERFPANLIHDNSEAVADILGDKSRYFYGTKANKKDRNEGLEDAKNTHPTVKPCDLMAYLCRLITPPGGTVLDPFMGSGSTGKACGAEGFEFIGVEMDQEYLAIAEARISFAYNQEDQDLGGAA